MIPWASAIIYIKPSNDISINLLEKFNTDLKPIVFTSNSSFENREVAKIFLYKIIDVSKKVENLLQKNIPVKMSNENKKKP